ncbi:hypothetical protein HWC29_gp053 [Aeromonas phage 4_4572]|uniref:Uncharacterized protein n=1 Tax=Aeromonas phage 4_4572 TaxID=2588517 RepID=A0A5B9NE83_9CAUD|nr:hypothetical protein HWC29_gp053 [Aeromonas phage 4_4572]QEG09133.1 hypothetical protein [Aeromonas phage 4_4572]
MKAEEKEFLEKQIEWEVKSSTFISKQLKDLKELVKANAANSRLLKETIATISRATANREGGSLSTAAVQQALISAKRQSVNLQSRREDLKKKLRQGRIMKNAFEQALGNSEVK